MKEGDGGERKETESWRGMKGDSQIRKPLSDRGSVKRGGKRRKKSERRSDRDHQRAQR